MGALKSLSRILSLIGKEIIEVFRRPGAVVSLVLGPFLVLAVFGLGYQGVKHDLRTIVVVPRDSGMPTQVSDYRSFQTRGVKVVEVTQDQAAAEQQLRRQTVDLVVVVPANARQSFEQGKQTELTVEMNETDPVQSNYASFLADALSSEVNREIYRRAAAEGKGYAVSVAGQPLASIPPEVIASPTTARVVNLAPIQPAILSYFGPAALALVLQHMAVTLLALSIVRDRNSGAIDLFRVAPIRTTELVLGKVLAFGILGGLIATVSVWLLVGVLHVPMLGTIGPIAGVLALLLLASLGLGLLISVVSDSERQAVQLSLLALLAAMFFSGFVLRIEEFSRPIQIAAYALPVTHGIQLLQDVMLRGAIQHAWEVAALGAIAAVLLFVSWALLRREMRPTT